MAKNSRKKRIINFRQMRVAEIWGRDKNQPQASIRQTLKTEFGIEVAQSTISRDLTHLQQRHWQKTDEVMNLIRGEMMEQYQKIFSEAFSAWVDSRGEKTTQIQESSEASSGTDKAKVQIKTEGQSGNPALLAQARGALKDIREMFGVDEDKKDVSGSDENPFVLKIIRGISLDDL